MGDFSGDLPRRANVAADLVEESIMLRDDMKNAQVRIREGGLRVWCRQLGDCC